MIAIIGSSFDRFRSLVDLYHEAGRRAGHPAKKLKVGLHVTGFLADSCGEGAFYPGWSYAFTRIGKERGWAPVTRAQFDASCGPDGPFLIGDPDTVIAKALVASRTLSNVSRLSLQMSAATAGLAAMQRSIELLGTKVAPVLRRTDSSPT